MKCFSLLGAALVLIAGSLDAAEAPAARLDRNGVLAETLKPYEGPSARGVDTRTLTGKLMCGYQGWFNCADDGAERGWVHWTKRGGAPSPANIKVDLWPDVSDLGADERFATEFRRADGSVAEVFSSYKKPTVLRHFQWMREYGIDGAFVQRFISGLRDPRTLRHNNTVLAHCREGANRSGRTYAVMYDLSGLRAGRIEEVMQDWRELRSRMRVTEDPAYLHHRGKPLVTVWGVGFNDGRAYTLEECRRLVEFLKNDPAVGGCAVMLGIPTYWRELKRDTAADPKLHEVLRLADVLSPWMVGRYGNSTDAARHADKTWTADIAWCGETGIDYLPVVFPGFSWHNMYGKPLDKIPRKRGEFFWSQISAAKRAGATMLYVAMFDEVDEGTAVFKCVNDPPSTGNATFLTYEGLPSDYYLRLCGEAARLLRGEIPVNAPQPSPGNTTAR